MPRKCSICEHPRRSEIDAALLGSETLTEIAKRFEISRAALFRHKDNHLEETVTEAVVEVVNASPEIREQELRTAEQLIAAIRIDSEGLEELKEILTNVLRSIEEYIGEPIKGIKDAKGRPKLAFAGKAICEVVGEIRKTLLARHRYYDLEAKVLKLIEGDEITINIFGSAEWLEMRERLFRCLEPYPEARRAVVEEFMPKEDAA